MRVTETLSNNRIDYERFAKNNLEDSQILGKNLHKALELIAKGKQFEVNNQSEVFEKWIIGFRKFAEQNNLKFVLPETKQEYVKLDLTGTPDLIAEVNGKLCLIDYKSGVVDKLCELQLGGYFFLIKEQYDIQGAYILKFNKETGEIKPKRYSVKELKYFMLIFLGNLQTYKFLKGL